MSTPPLVRRVVNRLFRVLDDEGVVFFQVLVYVHVMALGVYSVFAARGVPPVLSEALGHFNSVWPWLCIGTGICLIGKALSSNAAKTRYWVYTTGLIMQFVGDVFALGAFEGYVMATVQEASWGKPVAAAFPVQALAWCAFFLCVRDVRRWIQAEKAIRRRM